MCTLTSQDYQSELRAPPSYWLIVGSNALTGPLLPVPVYETSVSLDLKLEIVSWQHWASNAAQSQM